MDILFRCNGCQQDIVIDEAGAGFAVQCPKCGKGLIVPDRTVPHEKASEPSPANSASPAQRIEKAETPKGKQKEFDPALLLICSNCGHLRKRWHIPLFSGLHRSNPKHPHCSHCLHEMIPVDTPRGRTLYDLKYKQPDSWTAVDEPH